MSETVLDKFGRIDVLINNAAIFSTLAMQPFDQIPLEQWDKLLRVNTTGPVSARARWRRPCAGRGGARSSISRPPQSRP
jgi:NAD(P)-dependent dehydrogenase (short-subunit alcohol dehydrogenase family)